ncbi:MAG: hypothetical protein KO464_01340 [Candidatus Methanofastidiosum sp.]|nr:hypothetical protein [Methanofastidiosum sp.]
MNCDIYLKEKVLCKTIKYLFCYHKGCVLLRNINDKTLIQKLRMHSLIKSFRPIERLFRYEARCAISIDEDTFIFSCNGIIYNYSIKSNKATIEHRFDKGMKNPLTFCTRYIDGNLVDVIYGEYIWNENKTPVSIFRRVEGRWVVVYTFPQKAVTHVHNIVFDEYRNRYIILTGDSDNESGIWKADIDFNNVKPIVIGKQSYRSCVAFPTEKCVYYATDTPLEQNWIYELTEQPQGTANLLKVYKMPGPCICGRESSGSYFFATSVEGDPTQSKWKYRLSYRLGKGVHDSFVHIIKGNKYGQFCEIAKLKKDIFPIWLFQFGNAQFPTGEWKDGVIITPIATKHSDGRTLVINTDS